MRRSRQSRLNGIPQQFDEISFIIIFIVLLLLGVFLVTVTEENYERYRWEKIQEQNHKKQGQWVDGMYFCPCDAMGASFGCAEGENPPPDFGNKFYIED